MNSQYNRLLQNLDDFINRYYFDKIIRGVLFLVAIIISFFLLLILAEYFLFLKPLTRKIVTLSYLFVSGFSLVFFIGLPLLQLMGLFKKMSHEQAAIFIGKYYPEIDDKILNTIQLYKLSSDANFDNLQLLNASIEQRVVNFGVFSFKKAINLRLNRKYLKFALPPVFVLIIILIGSPTLIVEPTQRLVYFDSTFVAKAPFEFVLINDNLVVEEGGNFEIKLKLKGSSIPSEVSLLVDGFEYLMRKNAINEFVFVLEKVKTSMQFQFYADKYFSKIHQLKILHVPKIVDVSIIIKYPLYLQKQDEKLSNLTEIVLPEGSNIIFDLRTVNSDSILLHYDNIPIKYLQFKTPHRLRFEQKRIVKSTLVQLVPKNNESVSADTLDYSIVVVKDEFPVIRVVEFTDTVFEKRKFFNGIIKDDYGFSKLQMELNFKTIQNKDTSLIMPIMFGKLPTSQDFFHYFDFGTIDAKPGSTVNYSFVVADNDAINRPKSARSQVFSYQLKTNEQEQADAEKRSENLSSEIGNSSKEAEKLAKRIEKLTEKIRGKKDLSWEEKKEIEEMLKQFEKLQKKLEEHVKNADENLQLNKEELRQAEELNQKQEEIKKLMEELFTPEMKQMMNELQQMMEKNADKQKIEKSLEKMKMDAEFMQEQLDRELEMMKQLKFDQKLQQSIDKLKELSEKQQQLYEENLKGNDKDLQQKQEELNKEFKEFEKTMEEAQKANKELKEPNNLMDTKQKEEAIENEMEQSTSKMSSGKNKAAQKNQQNAAQKMKELSDELEQMQSEMEQENQGEDIENLKNILHNLVEISFNQERLMEKVKYTSNRDPQFPGFIEEQKGIVRDLNMVEDSLNKIAMRNPSISPVISKELKSLKVHSELVFNDLKELNTIGPTSTYQINQSSANQQFIMTSVNNLALMLSEALNQMQQEQMKKKSGKGSCKNPKPGAGSSGKMKSMREMQEALQKQMEKMKGEMEGQGQKPGGKGKAGGGEQMSEEMARMAAQQEALRKMLQEYRDKLLKEGKVNEARSLGEAARQMEQTETELVNKMLTAESLMRQKEIITRLLESEKAEREREQNEERESKEGKNQNKGNKNLILKYKELYNEDVELLKSIPPDLRPFYKRLVDSYFSN